MKLFKEKNIPNEEYKVGIIIKAISSGLFTGYIPKASGTFGSFIGFLVYMIPGFSEIFVLELAVIFGFVVGIFVSEIMMRRYGIDPPEVVIDEIVGLWFTYLVGFLMFEFFFQVKSFDPSFYFTTKLAFGIIGFLFFRFFDIIKLQPGKYFDEIKNGYGIMMDDIAAGLYAGILSSVITHFIWYKVLVHLFE
jgi:phosphatidylglycerophosphatase A